MTILVFRDKNETKYYYSHVSRRDRDFRQSILMVEREKMKLTLVENSRDREVSQTYVRVAWVVLVIKFVKFVTDRHGKVEQYSV